MLAKLLSNHETLIDNKCADENQMQEQLICLREYCNNTNQLLDFEKVVELIS